MQFTGKIPSKLNLEYRLRLGTALHETTIFDDDDDIGGTELRTGWELGAALSLEISRNGELSEMFDIEPCLPETLMFRMIPPLSN